MTEQQPIDHLLMHVLDRQPIQPRMVTIDHPDGRGWHAIALVIDGWYADKADADGVRTEYWMPLLDQITRDRQEAHA